MPRSKEKPSFKHHLGPICTLVFESVVVLLLLTHLCAGQSQVVTPSQPIVATLGDDIMLPCHLEPVVDATSETVEWARPDMDPRFVYVRRDGVDLETIRHPSYVGRTSLSIYKLKDGDISLKLDKVKVSDEGTYRCFVPTLQRESSVQLVVGATSSLIISLEKTDGDEDVSGAVLQCESKGWYPKPEVLWLDGEGKLLSAGPAEPIKGPDGLYTVSSRVTVEKKHSKSFTCRVQQKNINQTRETTFYVSDDLFKFPSSSSALTAGFAVSLSLCILLILLLLFFLWRRKRNKSKKTHQLEEGREREQLMSAETEKVSQQLQEEQQRRKEAEDKVKNLEDQLETKNKELETKNKEHKEEIEEKEKKLQTLKKELEKKIKEMGGLKDGLQKVREEKQKLENEKTKVSQKLQGEQQMRKNLEDQLETKNKEVETKKKELETKKKELETKKKELETKNKELETKNKEHKEEKQKKEKKLQTLKKELEEKNKELEKMQKKGTSSGLSPLPNETRSSSYAVPAGKQQAEVQRLSEEMQKKEKELQTLMDYWKKQNQRLEEMQNKGTSSDHEIKLKEENLQRLTVEKQKKEKELQKLKGELEEKNQELEDNQTGRTPSLLSDSSTPGNDTDAN